MAHQHSEQIDTVISSLRELQSLAKQQLTVVPSIASRVSHDLSRLDNYLSYLIGKPLQDVQPSRKFGPIVMAKKEPLSEGTVKSAEDMERDQLQHELEEIFPTFADRNPDELFDVLTDLQVRGVAIKAGMKVTETEPERITVKFVKEIQQKIIADQDRKNKIAEGQRQVNHPRKSRK